MLEFSNKLGLPVFKALLPKAIVLLLDLLFIRNTKCEIGYLNYI